MSHAECERTSELLVQLLDGSLSEKLVSSAESHLEQCVHCQKELESQSAEPLFWQCIGHINDDEFDLDRISRPDRMDCTDHSKAGNPSEHSLILDTVKGLLSPSDDPQFAGRIGAYEILGVIGAGGMGIVLKAKDPMLDRIVAVKILAPHLAANENARTRFELETKAAASVKHNGIIPIYGVDCHGNTPYFVMPFENGPSLQKRIESSGPLTVEESLRVAIQVADALCAAHESGLVHRDIKPSNILLAPGTERALLTDFGLAQLADRQQVTLTGMLAGTPTFMSPEQARGEAVDCRTDLFSLGSVLFTMLTGQPPVLDESPYAIIQRIASGNMPKLRSVRKDMPEWLEDLIARLHQLDPNRRLGSARETMNVLKSCQTHLKNPAEEKLPRFLRRPFKLRHVASLASIGGLSLIIFVFAYPFFFPASKPSTPNQEQNKASLVPSHPDVDSKDFAWDDALAPVVNETDRELQVLLNNHHWAFDTPIVNDPITTGKK